MVFLSRHDKGHRLSPSDINYRANIDVLKRAGVTDLVSLSACGSFKQELPPGTFVLVDQFVDRTHKRESSFFGKGCVAHVSMAHPVSPRLQDRIAAAAGLEGIKIVRGGTYVCMEGPQFSTYAESMTYKGLGYSVIGMTNLPEAKLAREAELCYATVAMVTDFDCWHPDHDAVTVQDIIKVLTDNADKAKKLVARLAQGFPARARAVSDRLRPRARHRADHRARGARQAAAQEARRGGGPGAEAAAEENSFASFRKPHRRQVYAVGGQLAARGCPESRMPLQQSCDSGLAPLARCVYPNRFAISRAAMVPPATAVATHGCAGLATSPTAKTPRQRRFHVAVDHEIAIAHPCRSASSASQGSLRVRPVAEQEHDAIDLEAGAVVEAQANPRRRLGRAPPPCGRAITAAGRRD